MNDVRIPLIVYWSSYHPLVKCPVLNAPTNGQITCSLRNDSQPTHGDSYSFTCNNGFKLNGSAIRTCQTNRPAKCKLNR